MTPECGYCGAEFGKPGDAEEHGLSVHLDDGETIYFEGDDPDLAILLRRARLRGELGPRAG